MYLIAGTGAQRAGKLSRVLVLGTPLVYSSWTVTLSSPDLPTTNFESFNSGGFNAFSGGQTFGEGLHGQVDAAVRFGGDWDAGTNPLDNPPGLFVRDNLKTLVLQINRFDATGWAFPWSRIRSSECGTAVGALVTFSCSGHSQGPFSAPTGSFSGSGEA